MKSALIVVVGMEIHTPMESANLFSYELKKKGFEVEIVDDLQIYGDSEKLRSLSLIIPDWTMGFMKKQNELLFLEAVMEGLGVAGWHGGLGDGFRERSDFQFMVGGQFVAHPHEGLWQVNVINKLDPITEGIGDFWLETEQYYMHVDPTNKVLATTSILGNEYPWVDGCVMPVIWKRTWGNARVFYASYGHTYKDFDVPEAKEIMVRGMMWASR